LSFVATCARQTSSYPPSRSHSRCRGLCSSSTCSARIFFAGGRWREELDMVSFQKYERLKNSRLFQIQNGTSKMCVCVCVSILQWCLSFDDCIEYVSVRLSLSKIEYSLIYLFRAAVFFRVVIAVPVTILLREF
jgi:hypothetical protein